MLCLEVMASFAYRKSLRLYYSDLELVPSMAQDYKLAEKSLTGRITLPGIRANVTASLSSPILCVFSLPTDNARFYLPSGIHTFPGIHASTVFHLPFSGFQASSGIRASFGFHSHSPFSDLHASFAGFHSQSPFSGFHFSFSGFHSHSPFSGFHTFCSKNKSSGGKNSRIGTGD